MAITKRPEAEATDAENRQAQIDNFGIGCAILEQAVDAMFAAGMNPFQVITVLNTGMAAVANSFPEVKDYRDFLGRCGNGDDEVN